VKLLVTASDANGVALYENFAIVADYDNGLLSIDISDVENLRQVDRLASNATTWEVMMHGGG